MSSRNQSEEVSLIQGKISKITVRSGEFVKKGQILASIAPSQRSFLIISIKSEPQFQVSY